MLGGIMALFGGLTATEQMALIGTCIAVLGFAVNTWAVWRRDKREQRFIEWKMVHKNDTDETL